MGSGLTEASSTGCALALGDHVAREAAVIAARYVRFRVVVVVSAVRMRRGYLAGGFRRKNPASEAVQVAEGAVVLSVSWSMAAWVGGMMRKEWTLIQGC